MGTRRQVGVEECRTCVCLSVRWLALKILHRHLEKLWQECGRFFVQTTAATASVLKQEAGSVALFGFIVNSFTKHFLVFLT